MASLGGNSTGSSASTPASTQTTSAGVCDRHGVSEQYTSNTDGNPFRRFVRCPQRRVSGCTYFEWVDDELPPYYLGCVQRLKVQKESLESQLQYKNLMIETLYARLRSKDAEGEDLICAKVPIEMKTSTLTRKVFIVAGVFAALVVAVFYQLS
ncbi:zinc knuckle family protein [Perilla frutescens var. hirtella]|nr:zinc knuckle family protein [Perilla frutescens var. hirtella]